MEGKKEINQQIQEDSKEHIAISQTNNSFDAMICQRRLDKIAISSPIQTEADILQYFHYWRARILDNVRTYSLIPIQQRQAIRRKFIICQLYGKRYLHIYLAFWFQTLLQYIKRDYPLEPQIIISQSELEEIFAQIYKTHKEPVQQLWPVPKQQKVEPPKEQKTFINMLRKHLVDVFWKKEQQLGPESRKMKKKI